MLQTLHKEIEIINDLRDLKAAETAWRDLGTFQIVSFALSLALIVSLFIAVGCYPSKIRDSPKKYLFYLVFVFTFAGAVSIANNTNRNIEIIALSILCIDLSVATFLHSSLELKWVYGYLFNLLGCGVALYFYYPTYKHQADMFLTSLLGSLIYGHYLLMKVFRIANKK